MIVRKFPQRVGWMESKNYSDAAANVDSTNPNVPNVLNKKKYVMLNGRIYEKPVIDPQAGVSALERRRREIVENFSAPTIEQEVSYEQQVGLQNQARVQDFVSRGQRDKQNAIEEQRAQAIFDKQNIVDNQRADDLRNELRSQNRNNNQQTQILRDEIKNQIGSLILNIRDKAQLGQYRADKNNAELVRTIHKLIDQVKSPTVNANGAIDSEIDWENTNLFDDLKTILGRTEDYLTDTERLAIMKEVENQEDEVDNGVDQIKLKEARRKYNARIQNFRGMMNKKIQNKLNDLRRKGVPITNENLEQIINRIKTQERQNPENIQRLADIEDSYTSTVQAVQDGIKQREREYQRNLGLLRRQQQLDRDEIDRKYQERLARAKNADERARLKAQEKMDMRRFDQDYLEKLQKQQEMIDLLQRSSEEIQDLNYTLRTEISNLSGSADVTKFEKLYEQNQTLQRLIMSDSGLREKVSELENQRNEAYQQLRDDDNFTTVNKMAIDEMIDTQINELKSEFQERKQYQKFTNPEWPEDVNSEIIATLKSKNEIIARIKQRLKGQETDIRNTPGAFDDDIERELNDKRSLAAQRIQDAEKEARDRIRIIKESAGIIESEIPEEDDDIPAAEAVEAIPSSSDPLQNIGITPNEPVYSLAKSAYLVKLEPDKTPKKGLIAVSKSKNTRGTKDKFIVIDKAYTNGTFDLKGRFGGDGKDTKVTLTPKDVFELYQLQELTPDEAVDKSAIPLVSAIRGNQFQVDQNYSVVSDPSRGKNNLRKFVEAELSRLIKKK